MIVLEEGVKIYCPTCNDQIAKVVDGKLVVWGRHHGKKHTCVVDIEQLLPKALDNTQTTVLK